MKVYLLEKAFKGGPFNKVGVFSSFSGAAGASTWVRISSTQWGYESADGVTYLITEMALDISI